MAVKKIEQFAALDRLGRADKGWGGTHGVQQLVFAIVKVRGRDLG
jgi:hypothetical protein